MTTGAIQGQAQGTPGGGEGGGTGGGGALVFDTFADFPELGDVDISDAGDTETTRTTYVARDTRRAFVPDFDEYGDRFWREVAFDLAEVDLDPVATIAAANGGVAGVHVTLKSGPAGEPDAPLVRVATDLEIDGGTLTGNAGLRIVWAEPKVQATTGAVTGEASGLAVLYYLDGAVNRRLQWNDENGFAQTVPDNDAFADGVAWLDTGQPSALGTGRFGSDAAAWAYYQANQDHAGFGGKTRFLYFRTDIDELRLIRARPSSQPTRRLATNADLDGGTLYEQPVIWSVPINPAGGPASPASGAVIFWSENGLLARTPAVPNQFVSRNTVFDPDIAWLAPGVEGPSDFAPLSGEYADDDAARTFLESDEFAARRAELEGEGRTKFAYITSLPAQEVRVLEPATETDGYPLLSRPLDNDDDPWVIRGEERELGEAGVLGTAATTSEATATDGDLRFATWRWNNPMAGDNIAPALPTVTGVRVIYYRTDINQMRYASESGDFPVGTDEGIFPASITWLHADFSSITAPWASGTGRFATEAVAVAYLEANFQAFRDNRPDATRYAYFDTGGSEIEILTYHPPVDATLAGERALVDNDLSQDFAFSWASPQVQDYVVNPAETNFIAFYDPVREQLRYYDPNQTSERPAYDNAVWGAVNSVIRAGTITWLDADVDGGNGAYAAGTGRFASTREALEYLGENKEDFRDRFISGRTRVAWFDSANDRLRVADYTLQTDFVPAGPFEIEVDLVDHVLTVHYAPVAGGIVTVPDTLKPLYENLLEAIGPDAFVWDLYGGATNATPFTRDAPFDIEFSGQLELDIRLSGYALGPPQNTFIGNTEAEAITARNTYQNANPSWVAAYQENQRLWIALRWGAGGDGKAQIRDTGGRWRDISFVLKGDKGKEIDTITRDASTGQVTVTFNDGSTPQTFQVDDGTPGGGAIERIGDILDGTGARPANDFIATGIMLGERGETPQLLYRLVPNTLALIWFDTDGLYDIEPAAAGDDSTDGTTTTPRNRLRLPELAGSSISGSVDGGITVDNELLISTTNANVDITVEFFRYVPSAQQAGGGLSAADRAELTRLSGVETDATADQTAGQIAILLDGLIGDAEWRTRLSGAALVDAIDAAVGNAIWRTAHTVQRTAQQIVDLLDVALGGDGWRTGGGGGGGITVSAATDAAGALLATLAQFSYDENDDTLTFVPSPPHMQVVRTPNALLISGAGVAGGPFGTAGVIPTVDPDGPGAMSSAQAGKLASIAGGANQLIPYKIGNIYRAFAEGEAVVKPGNDEGTVTAAGITDAPDNWVLVRPEATAALPYVYDCHVYGYLTNGLFGVQYGTPNRTDRYIAPGGTGIDMATANGLIQAALAAAVTGNTETGIAVTYNDDGTFDFVVGAGPAPSDDLYFGTSADAIPEPAEATIDGVAGRGTIPIYDGLLHQLIFQLASETDITSAVRSDDSTMSNLLAGFTKYGDTVIPAGETEPFDVWVSNQALSNPSAFDWIVS